jgi:hypothetical protein
VPTNVVLAKVILPSPVQTVTFAAEKAKSTATNGLICDDVNTVFNALVIPRLMMPPMLNR